MIYKKGRFNNVKFDSDSVNTEGEFVRCEQL